MRATHESEEVHMYTFAVPLLSLALLSGAVGAETGLGEPSKPHEGVVAVATSKGNALRDFKPRI